MAHDGRITNFQWRTNRIHGEEGRSVFSSSGTKRSSIHLTCILDSTCVSFTCVFATTTAFSRTMRGYFPSPLACRPSTIPSRVSEFRAFHRPRLQDHLSCHTHVATIHPRSMRIRSSSQRSRTTPSSTIRREETLFFHGWGCDVTTQDGGGTSSTRLGFVSSCLFFFGFDWLCCTSHASCLHVALDPREASFRNEGWPRGPCVAMPCAPVRWSVRAGA